MAHPPSETRSPRSRTGIPSGEESPDITPSFKSSTPTIEERVDAPGHPYYPDDYKRINWKKPDPGQ